MIKSFSDLHSFRMLRILLLFVARVTIRLRSPFSLVSIAIRKLRSRSLRAFAERTNEHSVFGELCESNDGVSHSSNFQQASSSMRTSRLLPSKRRSTFATRFHCQRAQSNNVYRSTNVSTFAHFNVTFSEKLSFDAITKNWGELFFCGTACIYR